MRTAVLAWGSLVWEIGVLKIVGEFLPGGPELPVEFSRVSKSKIPPTQSAEERPSTRLTLVIDQTYGETCGSYVAQSALRSFDEARENLRLREGMTHVNGVGFVKIAADGRLERSERAVERHQETVKDIEEWLKRQRGQAAKGQGYDAVIWTALAPNFSEVRSQAFSHDTAIRFLEGLERTDPVRFTEALAYFRNAPPAIQTKLRRLVDARWPSQPAEIKHS